MGAIFNMEGPLMQGLTKFADLIILNVITLICCIPVVTIGAAFTSLHYVCLKMVRGEDCYIVKDYFKAFKSNFKQATIIWLIFFVAIFVFAMDIVVMYVAEIQFHFLIRALVLMLGIVVTSTFMYVFPMQAKFANPVKQTIKNAFKASVLQFPKTIIMIAMMFVPPFLIVMYGNLIPIVIMTFIAVPAYVSAIMYNKFFKKIERMSLEPEGENGEAEDAAEDERIFHDELDSVLTENDVIE